MRVHIVVSLATLAACQFTHGALVGTGDGALPGDGDPRDGDPARDGGFGADASFPDGPGGQPCYGPAGWVVCLPAMPAPGTTTLSGSFNTDTDQRCLTSQPTSWVNANQPAACFVVRQAIDVNNLDVTGTRPLVLVADQTITISGVLDVGSDSNSARTGPAANSSACRSFLQLPQTGGDGGGGCAGGSFMTKGGDGGVGDNGARAPGLAPPAETMPPTTLRGGCAGQTGGNGTGTAGAGGGAVYLVAGGSVTGSGAIDAAGAGAMGCTGSFCSGRGAGSGGMVVISAPSITVAALNANGGGGASGTTENGTSQAGSDPVPLSPLVPALGGTTPANTRGGDGYAGGIAAGTGGAPAASGGGGGGGGGAGAIRTTVAPTGTVSPPASSL